MSLWGWIRDLLFGAPTNSSSVRTSSSPSSATTVSTAAAGGTSPPPVQGDSLRKRPRLAKLRFVRKSRQRPTIRDLAENVSEKRPYMFARPCVFGGFFNLASDGDKQRLAANDLPVFETPEQLAAWLGLPPHKIGWLVHRFNDLQVPAVQQASHYIYRWVAKRSGGERLIEAPKPLLKAVQQKILTDILDKVPPHSTAHGFRAGRSIVTNAKPHVGRRVVVRVDLQNFYPAVGYSRVTAIFRSLGYSREVATWLARLTTTRLPLDCVRQSRKDRRWQPYLQRHLPQGAPTSPALANLSAFPLDLRLAGLARKFGATYTRYADDLTFSGDRDFLRSLAVFLPLVRGVIRACRFRPHPGKWRVFRSQSQQRVTGVIVNQKTNVARSDYERLKAILHNCRKLGPSTQNRTAHPDFARHLLGRIAHVRALNPARGDKLFAIYQEINWSR